VAAAALFYLRQAQNTCEHSRCWHAEKQAFDLQTCRCTESSKAVRPSMSLFVCASAWLMSDVICAAHTAWQIGFNVFLILLHSSSWTILKRGQSLAESPLDVHTDLKCFFCVFCKILELLMLMCVKL
jgi:hypothetical protein